MTPPVRNPTPHRACPCAVALIAQEVSRRQSEVDDFVAQSDAAKARLGDVPSAYPSHWQKEAGHAGFMIMPQLALHHCVSVSLPEREVPVEAANPS